MSTTTTTPVLSSAPDSWFVLPAGSGYDPMAFYRKNARAQWTLAYNAATSK